jgi:hypothetical protein
MSPEQAAGFTDVDARTDVYALAILVYEMIVGEIPGRWVTEDSTKEGRFIDAAAKHRPLLSAAGAAVECALVRALALRPDHRTATPGLFIDELHGKSGSGRRKYRPDEIEAIVNRAAEIEAANPSTAGSMTIGGVEQIARDVGIDPTHVRSAAAALSPRAHSRESGMEKPTKSFWAGGPTRLLYERMVMGEVDEADFPILVEEIRIALREVGQVAQLGRSFTWTLNKGSSGTRNIEVAITVRAGRTRIIVTEALGNLIGAIYGGIGGGLGGGGMGPLMGGLFGGLKLPGEAALIVLPVWLSLVYLTARTSYHYAVVRREKVLENLANRLADLAQELIGPVRLADRT